MFDLLKTLVETYGPTWGPALFFFFLIVAVLISRIERKVWLHVLRLNIALLDKDLFTFDELKKYNLIDDNMSVLELLK